MATASLSERIIHDLESLRDDAKKMNDYKLTKGFSMALSIFKEDLDGSFGDGAVEVTIAGLRSLANGSFFDEGLVAPLLLAADTIEEAVERDSLAQRTEGSELRRELEEAEAELLAWTRGERSSLNAQLEIEVSPEDRGATLVRVAQQDAAELELAAGRVRALRLLLEG